MFQWLRRRKVSKIALPTSSSPVATSSSATDLQINAKKFHDCLLEKMRAGKTGSVDHETLQAAALLFFNVDLPTCYWKLRYSEESLLYFKINQVFSVFGEDGELQDIRLTLSDDALGTSLCLAIGIRDVGEMLLPVIPKVSIPSSAPKPEKP